MTVTAGDPEPLGVTLRGEGVNVAVYSANASAIEFCLFEGERETRRMRLRGRTGAVFHDYVADVGPGARYGLRAHGAFLPREGHWFNPAKLLIDPYATAIDRSLVLHPSMFGYRTGAPEFVADDTDSGPHVPKAIVAGPCVPIGAGAALTSWSRTVLYELHVKGFTARHPGVPEILRGRFAGLAHPSALEHLVRLGVTTVEIMPAAAWIEERHLAAIGMRNYWGYNPIAFMAPDPGLAPGGWDEVRATVAALAEAGIEVVLDVVLNHSGEGDARGPTLSLRGLDNATYYRELPGGPWRFADDTGCGNTMALDRPAPLRLAMVSLRTWAERTGLHGFRFDLATTLGRRASGFDPVAPLLAAIDQDPMLRGMKLIAEPWDVGTGGYQVGAFPAAWAEWNDRFRDGVRRFWRGDPGQPGDLATRLAGSADLFAHRGEATKSVNFVVAHDGFTLADLVSYTRKVNAANGEANRDGTDENFSWNNDAEGSTADASVLAARRRDQRALLATLLLARGTPMLAMGSEFGQSQGGNNNAYAQDNATAWLDWQNADAGMIAWTRHLLRLRRDWPVLRDTRFLTGTAHDISLLPDVEWSDAGGQAMTPDTWQASPGDILIMTLAGPNENEDTTDRVSIVLHRGRNAVPVVLPRPRGGYAWHRIADSAADGEAEIDRIESETVSVAARAVVVLAERPIQHGRAPDPALLDRLARAAGIAPEWWNVDRRRTLVSDDTKRALLAAMRLPAATEAEARDTLRQLSEDRDRRALPHAVVARPGGTIGLNLAIEAGLGRRTTWLTIEREDGETKRVRLDPDAGALAEFAAADGAPALAWRVGLPALPEGRHLVWREDVPDAVCHLTVAPGQCYLPETLRRGGRRFGVSAQLYALRRRDDPGIGDFTTLSLLAEAAAREGAATVGISPPHMLFPAERERASPYQPSDRRFVDPIFLDVGDDRGAVGPDFVAYSEVWARKCAVLESRFAAFPSDASEVAAFDRFVRDGGRALWRFAVFQAIAETRSGEAWRQWPEELRSPDGNAVAEVARATAGRVRFHQYLQFLADRQFAEAATRASTAGLELGFYRDLAVGAAPDGAEAWSTADKLARGAWIGAPPDPFAAEGQNWHLPPPLPLSMARDGFRGFAELIAANMRHAGALRIDHAMGLARLFWIPDGGTGADGAYVAYPFADLLGQVALESTRARCMVVGEDLGTVPDGFRPELTNADILSYRVLLLERDGRSFRPTASWPARAVACVSTHDLPPLAGWWEGADIRERALLGLLPALSDAEAEREAERIALVDALAGEGCLEQPASVPPDVSEVVAAAHRFVAASPADLALVQVEDLAGMRVGVNLPGTDRERPNWRMRLPMPVETLFSGGVAQTILGGMRASGRGTAGKAGES